MPSSVRQRLPIDLWQYQSHRNYLHGNPHPVYHTQEIRAIPCDSYQEDKRHRCQGNQKYSHQSQRNHSKNQRNSKTFRRGSVNTLTTGLSDSEGNSSGVRSETAQLSGSAKSDNNMNVSLSLCNDAYTVDSFVAPDPSQLPLPPLEWLQFSLKRTVFPVGNHMTLQSILRCLIAT